MKPTSVERPPTRLAQLADFLLLALRLAPKLLWWLLAVLGFAFLNLFLQDEVWPNTPNAEFFFLGTGLTVLLSLVWTASTWAWRLADAISCNFWRSAWRLVAVLGFIGAAIITAMALVLIVIQRFA